MSNSPMLSGFDRVYIINLQTRPDRWREIQEQLNKVGIDPTTEKVQRFDAVRPADAGAFPSIGARGCFMSHLGVLEDARRHGYQRILVLEDDLDFKPDFPQKWPVVCATLQTARWGMFYGTYELSQPLLKPKALAPELIEADASTSVGTTPFLAFQGPVIGQACDYLAKMLARPAGSPEGGPMHVDGAYNWLRQAHPEVITLLASEQMGHQRPSKTDIHDLKWFDRLPVISDLAQAARRLKRSLSR